MRYGFVEQAQTVAMGLLDAAAHFGGRLPELFCGFDRADFPVPVPYPTSCSPQAWASAAPVLLMRALLRLDPDVPGRRLGLDPALPGRLLPFSIDQLPLAQARLRIAVESHDWKIIGLPAGMTVG
jgi:glycogen debranching enzyme